MFKENWIQEVAGSIQLAPLNVEVAKKTTSLTENQIFRVAALAQKFHRRSHQKSLTVDHINLALSTYNLEEIYGLSSTQGAAAAASSTSIHKRKVPEGKREEDEEEEDKSNAASKAASQQGLLSLVEIGRQFTLKPPSLPEMALHWLAIDGVQPVVPENPSPSVLKLSATVAQSLSTGKSHSMETAQRDQHSFPTLLSQEMQSFYHRCTSVLSTGAPSVPAPGGEGLNISTSALVHAQSVLALCRIFQSCTGLQELLPYLSQFFALQISTNIDNNLSVLWNVVRVVAALVQNPHVRLEFHIQQLLPPLLSTIVGAKVGASSAEEQQWGLRRFSAGVVSIICSKYTVFIPDLTARICKTYIDCFQSHRELTTAFGGIVGLSALGYSFVHSALLPKLKDLRALLEAARGKLKSTEKDVSVVAPGAVAIVYGSSSSRSSSTSGGSGSRSGAYQKVLRIKLQQCDSMLIAALGMYVRECMRLPSAALQLQSQSQSQLHSAAGGLAGAMVESTPVSASSSSSNGADDPSIEALISSGNVDALRQKMFQMQEELRRVKAVSAAAAQTGAGQPGAGTGSKVPQRVGTARREREQELEELLDDYAERLVPYYTQRSESLDYCRMWV